MKREMERLSSIVCFTRSLKTSKMTNWENSKSSKPKPCHRSMIPLASREGSVVYAWASVQVTRLVPHYHVDTKNQLANFLPSAATALALPTSIKLRQSNSTSLKTCADWSQPTIFNRRIWISIVLLQHFSSLMKRTNSIISILLESS
jgi:hypothetical protein